MLDLKDTLEIIIPSYNRCDTLAALLKTMLSSPVGNCIITVLDNNSTDGTGECVQQLSWKHSNIRYIKNRYNLGLAGNICKAMTIPTKKYFWICFDDMKLDFGNWDSIEKGIRTDNDCILTTNYYNVQNTTDLKERAAIFLMLIYCFSGIYKTDLINDNVLLYALTDIYTLHPQMALISAVFNDKSRKIYIPDNTIASPTINQEIQRGEKYTANRVDDFYHFRISSCPLSGFISALQALKDENLKKTVIQLLFEEYNDFGPYLSKASIVSGRKKGRKEEYVNYIDEQYFLESLYGIVNYKFKFLHNIIFLSAQVKVSLWSYLSA